MIADLHSNDEVALRNNDNHVSQGLCFYYALQRTLSRRLVKIGLSMACSDIFLNFAEDPGTKSAQMRRACREHPNSTHHAASARPFKLLVAECTWELIEQFPGVLQHVRIRNHVCKVLLVLLQDVHICPLRKGVPIMMSFLLLVSTTCPPFNKSQICL